MNFRIIRLVASVAVATILCGCALSSPSSSRTGAPPAGFDMGTLSLVVVKQYPQPYPAQEGLRESFLMQNFLREDRSSLVLSQHTIGGWNTKYQVFSQEIVRRANASGFDYEALSRILEFVRTDGQRQGYAYLPVGAYRTTMSGQPLWIVVLRWEVDHADRPTDAMGHIRAYAFIQRTLQQVGFVTCN